MGLPIGIALFGLAVGVSAMSLVAYVVDVPSWAPQLGSMVGLGVGIDYALFVVTRHRENLARGIDARGAVGRAVATAGQAVVFAGGTVVVAILGLAVAGVPFVTAGGIAIAVVVAIMVLASVTLLPAFLGLAGPWINRLGVPAAGAAATGAGWRRWGAHVTRHPWAYALAGTALLLALAAPVLALRVGIPDDGTLPEQPHRAPRVRPRRRGLRAGRQRAARDRRRHRARRARARAAAAAIARRRRDRRRSRRRRSTATASRRWSRSRPPGRRTRPRADTVARLRADVLPPGRSPAHGARAHVGGADGDLRRRRRAGQASACRCSSPP